MSCSYVFDIHNAASEGDLADIKCFLQVGADINCRDDHGRTILHVACREHVHVHVVQYLCENGADIHCTDGTNSTPLHVACFNSNIKNVKVLLQFGARDDVNKRDIWGSTPLHDATSILCDGKIVELLLYHGADPNILNFEGETPGGWLEPCPTKDVYEQHQSMSILREWRPWNHSQYPLLYRRAMATMVLIAKTH